ncbi:MAG: hypothetical protein JSW46_02785 [Gemmatimonadota bacterium]|nr:MAG: hypothetical protein JSW46_02785 [Gemmatimonadota bacterium]
MIHTLLLLAILGGGAIVPEMTGEDVIRAMHDRYTESWYRDLALVQTVNYYDVQSGAYDSARVWYESIRLPGTVRSDVAPLDAGNCILFKDQTWIFFEADTVVREEPGQHPILLLGFDVYVQPVEETIATLQAVGFDLSLEVREDEWQGRAAYVVGDENRQFWIDKEELLFVRLLAKNPNTGAEREILFDGYERLGGGWIATEITFMRSGRVDIYERYDYWTIDVEFEPSLFLLTDRTRPTWIKN